MPAVGVGRRVERRAECLMLAGPGEASASSRLAVRRMGQWLLCEIARS
jgi:hypothetical protein